MFQQSKKYTIKYWEPFTVFWSTRLIVLFFMAQFSLTGCHEKTPAKKQIQSFTIDIQPFDGILKENVSFVVNEISKIYPHVHLLPVVELPPAAYYAERNRYKADSLINFLSNRTIKDHITIGLTERDISTTKGNIKDWGVMGLGYCPGKACIASSFRLSATATRLQLFKIALHELGHTEGLLHCKEKTCFMRDAEGGNPMNEETGFCVSCAKLLQRKGWLLK